MDVMKRCFQRFVRYRFFKLTPRGSIGCRDPRRYIAQQMVPQLIHTRQSEGRGMTATENDDRHCAEAFLDQRHGLFLEVFGINSHE